MSPGSPQLHSTSEVQASEEFSYESHEKIQVRSVDGFFASWRWGMVWFTQLIFYGLPWLVWNGHQEVLLDLSTRKFYLFGLILWPQDMTFLALLLIIAAYALFLFAAVAGRLFCGYACPQTVYTEIFMWIESRVEGDRLARIKLDAEPLSPRKLARKATKQALWIGVALWTGFTFVSYFTPIRQLATEVLHWQTGGWESFWILFYGFATYGNAGYMREQVCKHMCPYSRFQSAMLDRDTMIVAYDAERGDPRGKRKRGADARAQGQGDCVDCSICVQVCPTGIDIRDGLQYMCIGCGACVDACNQVMDKMGSARGLIRYSSENAVANHWTTAQQWRNLLRPRIVIYTAILGLMIAFLIGGLAERKPIKLDITRDRRVLAREIPGEKLENVYQFQLMNVSENPLHVTFSVSGLPGLTIAEPQGKVDMAPSSSTLSPLRVSIPDARAPASGIYKIDIVATSDDVPPVVIDSASTFIVP
jgi:cytochrome c oxidase accessory protein FixG